MNYKKIPLEFIKGIIPVIGVVVAIWATFFHGDDRELSYEVVSKTELKALKGENWPDIGLWYEKKVIENGGLVTLRLINTGNVPLYAKEFDGPILFKLKPSSRFMAAKVIEVHPKDLNPSLVVSANELRIKPMLLNPDDEMLIQTIVQGSLSNIEVSARIGGIKEATDLRGDREKTHKRFSLIFLGYGFLCFVGYALLGPVAIWGKAEGKRELSRSSAILLILLIMLPGVGALIYFSRVQGVESGWVMFFSYMALYILAEIFALLFRPKEQSIDPKQSDSR